MLVICRIMGHNKVHIIRQEGDHKNYYDYCTQCHRKWFNTQLSEGTPVSTIKLRLEEVKSYVKSNIKKQ